jgi:hypothetical protein
MEARPITRVRMTRIITARITRTITVSITPMYRVKHTIGTHIRRCIPYTPDTGLVIMDFRYRVLASIITITAGINTGTETSIGMVNIIMGMDPVITINQVITQAPATGLATDPATVIPGPITRGVVTKEAGTDEKKNA